MGQLVDSAGVMASGDLLLRFRFALVAFGTSSGLNLVRIVSDPLIVGSPGTIVRGITLRRICARTDIQRIDGVNLPKRNSLRGLSNQVSASHDARLVAVVVKKLAGDAHRILHRRPQIDGGPGRGAKMRNHFGSYAGAFGPASWIRLGWIHQRNVEVVRRDASGFAIHVLAGFAIGNVGIQNKGDEAHHVALADFGAVQWKKCVQRIAVVRERAFGRRLRLHFSKDLEINRDRIGCIRAKIILGFRLALDRGGWWHATFLRAVVSTAREGIGPGGNGVEREGAIEFEIVCRRRGRGQNKQGDACRNDGAGRPHGFMIARGRVGAQRGEWLRRDTLMTKRSHAC